jgi:putative heme-binding domain-containing protein
VCGNCHKLFGEGKEIGPDLTGSNRRDRNYILENVLAPNAIIGNAYQMHALLMDDGRLVTGLVREETENAIRVVMTAGTEVTLDPAEVESRKLSEQSMMPMELLDNMHPADVVDLIAYLAGDKQVLPSKHRTVGAGETDPANVIEAEWLVSSARPSAGRVQRQNMGSFPDQWSGDAQLWWTGSRQGGTLELSVATPHSGSCDVSIFLTTAVDYPIMRAKVNDQAWQSSDLFTKDVRLLPKPLQWSNVELSQNQTIKLTFEMTGANPGALKRWMLGIDRIEIVPQVE